MLALAAQFHAVALLHALRASDRLAISKLVSSLVKANVKSPLAQCLLVRYVAQVRHQQPQKRRRRGRFLGVISHGAASGGAWRA